VDAYFFDSSALAKCYLNEAGTAWTRALMQPAAANALYAVAITELEVTSAIVRRQRSGSLSATEAAVVLGDFRQDFQNEFQVLDVAATLVASAAALVEVYGLRAYDALHLAGALEVNKKRAVTAAPLTLVSADQELNAAAVAEGLAVEDPNQHP
jgi:predicted nucleic acid-binding protein